MTPYTAVVTMRGSVGWTARSTPATTGAMTPARRESAADVPHAVPRIVVPNVSGVMPSAGSAGAALKGPATHKEPRTWLCQ